MATQLTDITVDRISFVKTAAQRSANDPTQPQRFLLWKSEDGAAEPIDDATTRTPHDERNDGMSDITPDGRTKLRAAHSLLSDALTEHAMIPHLHRQLGEVLDPPVEQRAIAKMRGRVAELQKSDPSLSRAAAMERVRKSDPQLQRELAGASA